MRDIVYDVDNMGGDVPEDHVEVCQYLLPTGRTFKTAAPLGKEYHEKAKGLIITAEKFQSDEVAIYIRKEGTSLENERMRLFFNGPGPNGVIEGFKKFIDDFLSERDSRQEEK